MLQRSRKLNIAMIVVGTASTVAFGYLAVRDVHLDTFRETLADSNYLWLVPALLALAAGVVLRAYRWQLLFERATRPPLGAVTTSLLIGYFVNQILPVRAGEVARILALHQNSGASRAEAAGTALTERVYDVLSLLFLLFVAAPLLPPVDWLRRAALIAITCAIVLTGLIVAVIRWRERPIAFLLKPLAVLPRVSSAQTRQAAVNLVRGLSALYHARLAIPALIATMGSWFCLVVAFWCALQAVQLGLGVGAGLLVVIATNLALILPSAPAAVGVFEAAVVLALNPFGVDDSQALAAAVVLHAFNLFPFLLCGAVAFNHHAMVVRRRTRAAVASAEP